MKFKIFIATIFCFLFLTPAVIAGPFLVCDPQKGVDYYNVYQDGKLIAEKYKPESDGSLRYDLKELEPGEYNFDAEACNGWGCEKTVNPYRSEPAATKPENLRIILSAEVK